MTFQKYDCDVQQTVFSLSSQIFFIIHTYLFDINFKMSNGTLKVTILEARHLKDKDIVGGKDDAYVELYLDKNHKQRTTTIKDSNNPIWNETFIL